MFRFKPLFATQQYKSHELKYRRFENLNTTSKLLRLTHQRISLATKLFTKLFQTNYNCSYLENY